MHASHTPCRWAAGRRSRREGRSAAYKRMMRHLRLLTQQQQLPPPHRQRRSWWWKRSPRTNARQRSATLTRCERSGCASCTVAALNCAFSTQPVTRRVQEARVIKSMVSMTHREKVERFNEYLSSLSEHHDIPKVRPVPRCTPDLRADGHAATDCIGRQWLAACCTASSPRLYNARSHSTVSDAPAAFVPLHSATAARARSGESGAVVSVFAAAAPSNRWEGIRHLLQGFKEQIMHALVGLGLRQLPPPTAIGMPPAGRWPPRTSPAARCRRRAHLALCQPVPHAGRRHVVVVPRLDDGHHEREIAVGRDGLTSGVVVAGKVRKHLPESIPMPGKR